MNNLTTLLDEVQKNQAIIERLTRNNSLIMTSIVRDTTVNNVMNLPGVTDEIRAILGTAFETQATPIAPLYPGSRSSSASRAQLPAIEAIEVDVEDVTEEAPRKRKGIRKTRKNGRNKVPRGFHAQMMVDFAKKNGRILDISRFKQENSEKLSQNFLNATVYQLKNILIKKGVFVPTKSDPRKLRLANAAAV